MKAKFFRVHCDYNLNKHRHSACDEAGAEYYISCEIDELHKKLAEAIADRNKKFSWKHPEMLKISFGEAEPGKPDYEYIESQTVGEKWKPQIFRVYEETLFS